MAEHQGQTNEVTKVELPSAIDRVMWTQPIVAPGGRVGLEVFTRYVSHGSTLEIELSEKSGQKHGTFTQKIHGNYYRAPVPVPASAKEALYATVKLPDHNLQQKSLPLFLLPPVEITGLAWSSDHARRGEILTLSARVKGLNDGAQVEVAIFEHDPDEAHELLTRFPAVVERGKVEAEWAFQYHGNLYQKVKAWDGTGPTPPQFFPRACPRRLCRFRPAPVLLDHGSPGGRRRPADGGPGLPRRVARRHGARRHARPGRPRAHRRPRAGRRLQTDLPRTRPGRLGIDRPGHSIA